LQLSQLVSAEQRRLASTCSQVCIHTATRLEEEEEEEVSETVSTTVAAIVATIWSSLNQLEWPMSSAIWLTKKNRIALVESAKRGNQITEVTEINLIAF